jgi:hypothetical protein
MEGALGACVGTRAVFGVVTCEIVGSNPIKIDRELDSDGRLGDAEVLASSSGKRGALCGGGLIG